MSAELSLTTEPTEKIPFLPVLCLSKGQCLTKNRLIGCTITHGYLIFCTHSHLCWGGMMTASVRKKNRTKVRSRKNLTVYVLIASLTDR
jgi:hypothetical protein